MGWYSTTPDLSGLGWGLLAAPFCGIVPYGILIFGARLGWWSDHHMGARKQRLVPRAVIIACVCAGSATLVLLGAPRSMVALVVAMLATLFVTLAVTVVARWKISVHTAAAGGVVVLAPLTYGAHMLALVPLAALVAWSRVRLGATRSPK